MKNLVVIVVNLLFALGFSQEKNGKITGCVSEENGTKIELANITLHKSIDSTFVKASITNKDGYYEFENINEGDYYLKINFPNFEKYKSDKITISQNQQVANLPVIQLKSTSKKLSEVVVTKEKQFVERKLDKLVVNVENSIVSAGSTVLEVLQRSPGVTVNEETSINLKGKSGVIVMIDGKPTPLSGADLMAYLKSIPATNIQNIEIITNPSAKYDASGNAGIINLKFKKDKRDGFNGSTTLSYGQGIYPKPSASLNLNYRNKKWNFFGSHSIANPHNYTYFFINRKFFDNNQNHIATFEQISNTKQPVLSNNTRLGVDFYANDKTVFGILLNGNFNKNKRDGNTDATVTDANGILDYRTNTNILLNENRFNGFANFNFKHSFNTEGREITADLDYGQFDANTVQDITNKNTSPSGSLLSSSILNTQQEGLINVKSIKADYSHPFSKGAKLEAGLKSSLVTSDNDVRFYDVISGINQLDPSRSNHFIYKENINALYSNFSKEFTKWDFQLGLRMEHTNTNGEQLSTNESFSRDYVNFFPNAVINRKFEKENSISLSYSKRIDRPTYRQLNPFRVFVDSYTYVSGDPKLKPVITNLYELNYTFRGKYIATLSYNKSKESITDIFVQDDVTKISYQIPANMQDFEQYNLGIYVPIKYKTFLNSTLSASLFQNKYSSPLQGGNLKQEFTSWDMNMNNNFNLGKGWTAELSGLYQSKQVWGLFYIRDLAQITTGVQKTSKNKNSTLKFSVSDIFKTNHIAVIVKYQNQDWFTERNWDSKVATLTYTYRFGKSSVAKARQHNSGVEEEKKRAS